jgi:orotidine-5'-phosphate decarboxylase
LGLTKDCGLIVNSTRAIIYASGAEDFADAARKEARALQAQMAVSLEKFS